MNDVRERAAAAMQALPMVHRITLVAVGVGLIMATVAFATWITTPEMTILASQLSDADLAEVVDELETAGVTYEIGNGGTSVLVPRDELYSTRARMASAGVVTGDGSGGGWEILDESGIAVNQDQMEINIQRALEGELSRTLTEMDGVDAATVHLVRPEERLFTEQQQPATASVLLDTRRSLTPDEVEAVVFLVSSAVEGLETGAITVADVDGVVLHAPGDAGGAAGANRQLRQTRDFELALADDIQRLLTTATGSSASVVVRASLDFDETTVSQRILDPQSQVAISEQDVQERYEGVEPVTTGVVGVAGGPVDGGDAEATTDYERSEILREYGVSETTTTTSQAPGRVDGLSVAIVMDDGSLTGAAVPAEDEVAALVAAAVGLDEARGDTVAVTAVAFPAAAEVEEPVGTGLASTAVDMASRIAAIIVFLIVAVALFLMSRRRDRGQGTIELDAAPRQGLPPGEPAPELVRGDDGLTYAIEDGERVLIADAVAAGGGGGGAGGLGPVEGPALGRRTPPKPPVPPDDTARREVEAMVERQPEEIANLLRGWLADAS